MVNKIIFRSLAFLDTSAKSFFLCIALHSRLIRLLFTFTAKKQLLFLYVPTTNK